MHFSQLQNSHCKRKWRIFVVYYNYERITAYYELLISKALRYGTC